MTTDITKLSFEQAYRELSDIIDQMESGELELEASVQLYERGQQLAMHCEQLLSNAELRVQQINKDGNIENFD